MNKVIIESPYSGDLIRNLKYARMCLKDSLLRGEAPLASHLLYTQEGVLDDTIESERALGIGAGLIWGKMADKTVVYEDYGISNGMQIGINDAKRNGRPIEYRHILKYNNTR